jgi:hypothetical protein
MGQQIEVTGLLVGSNVVQLSELVTLSEAAKLAGTSTTRIYQEMGRRPDLDSFVVGNSRFLRREAVDLLRADLEAGN